MDIYSLKCWLGHSPEHMVCVIYFMDYSPDPDFITSGAFMNSLLRDFSHNDHRDIFSLNVELVEKAR